MIERQDNTAQEGRKISCWILSFGAASLKAAQRSHGRKSSSHRPALPGWTRTIQSSIVQPSAEKKEISQEEASYLWPQTWNVPATRLKSTNTDHTLTWIEKNHWQLQMWFQMPLLLCQLSCCASIFHCCASIVWVVPSTAQAGCQFRHLDNFTFGSSRKRGSWRKRGWHCAIVHLGSNVVYISVAQTLPTNVYSTLYIEVQPSPVPSSSSPWPRQPACPLLQLQYVIMCTRGCHETQDRALQDQPGWQPLGELSRARARLTPETQLMTLWTLCMQRGKYFNKSRKVKLWNRRWRWLTTQRLGAQRRDVGRQLITPMDYIWVTGVLGEK